MLAMRPLLFLFLLVGSIGSAHGSTARRASLPELVDASSLVVVATITHRSSYWNEGRIYTRNQAQLKEVWLSYGTADPEKNRLTSFPPNLDLITLGGVVGEIGQKVSGSPTLKVGSAYVLFLVEGTPGQWHVVGLSQGALQLEGDTLIPLSNIHDLKLIGSPGSLPTSRIKLRAQVLESGRRQR